MRITILSPPFNLSGGLRVMAIYADRLTRRGHEVVVVAPPPAQRTFRQNVKSLIRGRGWVGRIPQGPSHFDSLDVDCRVLDRYRPVRDADVPDADVVVATWWETAEWAAGLAPGKGTKILFTQGYEAFVSPFPERLDATWQLPFQKIAVSQWLVDLARERFGDDGSILVPNSADQVQFRANPRSKNPRPTVGLLYSTSWYKGCEVSLRALELCSRAIPDLHVVAFGNESPSRSLPLPPGSDFFLTPGQDKLRDIYALCDVWLCGSRSEGFHLPPSEAMACRCPVVSTRVGGPMDIIRDGVNGYLADIGDAEKLAERLIEVLRMPEESWRRLSDGALETVRQYTWDDATDRFEAALLTALERQRHVPSR